jgi:hypothetical protein
VTLFYGVFAAVTLVVSEDPSASSNFHQMTGRWHPPDPQRQRCWPPNAATPMLDTVEL